MAKDLGKDLRTEDIYLDEQQIRQCLFEILRKPFNPGSIYLDNTAYDGDENSTLVYTLKDTKPNLTSLWSKWLKERSPNVAYIPPECLPDLPHLTADISKVDSWAAGCLLAHLLNLGKPLTLKRFWQNGPDKVVFGLNEGPLLENLQTFYKHDSEAGLMIGPEIPPIPDMSAACKEFLECSLNRNAAERSSLQELQAHRFIDMSKSLEELNAPDRTESYPVTTASADQIKIINIRQHPFLKDTSQCRMQVGEIQLGDSPGIATGQTAEIWRFQLLNEKTDREFYMKAFKNLLNLLNTMPDQRIGRLQTDSVNVVQFFGWRFAPPLIRGCCPEFQVYAEFCAGGNFEDAASHHLPLDVIQKWLYEMLCGLNFLHQNRVVHRNLSSRMRQLEADHTTKHEISARSGEDGRFVAPELINSGTDHNIGRKSDVWSAGCVALHLLTGQPPLYIGAKNQPMHLEMAVLYRLNNSKNPQDKLPFISESLPNSTRDFVLRCLNFDPKERPHASDLLARGGPLSDFTNDPDNPERYPNLDMKTLPQSTLEYWENNYLPGP
ncbi:uncharacterized protein LOC129597466 isoform X2 [Paramacrobiotus metropolitanus]|uniref:uncharacterized protein LOC129597466 isoform X2 n=1 Tax=Paramacrobiotus metropolitanus TaxID=2943436 RepID=UPI0024459146|nr:uncharacterized protein LOC129597466 isoform X2 [Paramacrobiotus metropolitanus]